jgi:creatinine amidohydrolase/Fe(II)-dependent formamide hydrolase-like protein
MIGVGPPKAKVAFTRTLDRRWIGRSGNMGDPTRAQPEHGERIIQRTVEVGLELLTVLQQQREYRRIAAAKMEDKNE